jgi:hypothetical protein
MCEVVRHVTEELARVVPKGGRGRVYGVLYVSHDEQLRLLGQFLGRVFRAGNVPKSAGEEQALHGVANDVWRSEHL